MLRTALFAIAAAMLLSAHSQQFSPYKLLNTPVATKVQDVVAGDLDHDGDPDVVIGTLSGRVSVFFNEGGGSFSSALRLTDGMDRVYQVMLVDLDNDGDLDVTFAGWGTPDAGWFENLGGRSFGPMQTLVDDFQANTACSLTWADVDEDGDLDLFLTSYINDVVAYYRNNGNQGFGPREVSAGCAQAWVCEAADMDGDGHIDIVTAGDGVSWRDSQNGQFMGQLPYNGGYIATDLSDVRGMVLKDDGDGFPDIYVSEPSNDRVLRYSNNGTGNYSIWGTMTEFATNVADVGALRLVDLNGDGNMEIVAACSGDHTIRILSGGGFSGTVVSGVMGASGMAVADFNGDGYPDLVTAAANAGQVAVYAGNGTYQFTFLGTLNEVAGPVPDVAIVDVDGDGLNDIVESFYGAQVLGWKRNLGEEQFGPVQVIDGSIPGVQRFLMRDMDNDGDPDLIASVYLDRMVWYRNEGGVFSSALLITDVFGPSDAFDTGDFDGDGDLDLAAADNLSGSGYSVWWFANQGNGDMSAPVQVAASQLNVRRLVCADVNADGVDEIIYFRDNAQGTMICLNDGTGNFATPVVLDSSLVLPLEMRAADLNADGWADLVIDRQSTLAPMISLLSNGDGTFTVADTAGVGDGVMYGWMDLADMDSDGDLDLVAAATNLNYLYKWWANDGTGHFPLGQRIDSGYTAGGWAAGDLDDDGDPDVLTVHAEELRWYENFIQSRYSASGRIYYDVDESGDWSTGDVGMPGTAVICEPVESVPYSGPDGVYLFRADAGEYTLSAQAPNVWWELTSDPTYTIELTEQVPTVGGLDFRFSPIDTLIATVTSTAAPVRCDLHYLRWIDVVNTGTLDAQVQLDYVPQPIETILLADPAPDEVIDGTLRWNSTIPVFGTLHIELLAEIDGTPPQQLTDSVHAHITALNYVLDRSVKHVRPVLCAFDPNDKQVEPVGYGEFGAIDIATDRLTYTVRFQNTGTDTAFTVMVRDRLNARLDRASIQVLGSSHTLTSLNVENDGEAVFLFENILLPDSNVNEPASHGYVVFSIGVLPGAPDGTTIDNSVDIYFGGNEAVTTNTVLNTLVDCSLFGAAISWFDAGTLMANSGAHYQWYLNGEALEGDTLQMIFIPAPGMYTVQVTNRYGCETLSDPMAVINTGIAEADGLRVAIAPNPMDDGCRLVFSTLLPMDAQGTVVNASGAVVRNMSLGGIREYDLQRGELAAGMYLLRVHSETKQLVTRRFIVR
ncbi:MAG: T9SS type A sorting domain-containing protein [Flavobacteriales bacterium]|nr:T9SS type A sorting domain-containing protein [Flavobacteriales bacterium]